jgi:hypothetical protein
MRARRLQGGQNIGETAFLFNTSYPNHQGVPAKRSVPWNQARCGTLVLLPMAARLLSDDDLALTSAARASDAGSARCRSMLASRR